MLLFSQQCHVLKSQPKKKNPKHLVKITHDEQLLNKTNSPIVTNAEIYINEDKNYSKTLFDNLHLDRGHFGKIYTELLSFQNTEFVYSTCKNPVSDRLVNRKTLSRERRLVNC